MPDCVTLEDLPLQSVNLLLLPYRYRPPVLIVIFFYKIYSLCNNNAISKVLNKLQVFHFRCTVHTNTTPTVITHSCLLQKPPSYNGYKFEFKICRPNRHVSKILAKKVKY